MKYQSEEKNPEWQFGELEWRALALGYTMVPLNDTIIDTVRAVRNGRNDSRKLAEFSGITRTCASMRLARAEDLGLLKRGFAPGRSPVPFEIARDDLTWL